MIKKKYLIVILFMILFITIFTRFSFASDPTLAANAAATDNTIYDANPGQADAAEPAEPSTTQNPTVSYTELEDSSDLSITNMINIILAAIGVVLILLGIAILLKIK